VLIGLRHITGKAPNIFGNFSAKYVTQVT